MVKDSSANGKLQDEQFRKVFVGGLSLSTTEEALKEFYAQYGTITDCVVMKDPNTKRSRGFGFVTYTSMDEVDKAMKARPHVIDGKTVDPKRAVPREASQKNEANISTKRLYVSGVREDHQENHFNDYFGKYGNVEKVEIIKDKATGKYRGFAFISFDDYDPVDKCCLERQHMILNHRCDVKKALSKEEISKAQQMDRDRANRSNRSRGTERGNNSGWNDRGSGRPNAGGAWGGAPSGGYNAQPWNNAPAGGYNSQYSGYGPPAGNGGWGEQTPTPWGPPAANWQPGPPQGWQQGGHNAYPPQQQPPAQPWGAPPTQGAPGGWGSQNQRPY